MAKWILARSKGIGGYGGYNFLVNLDSVAIISQENGGNAAIIEWVDGNLQVTSATPNFDELMRILGV